jgi:hypothetical protein
MKLLLALALLAALPVAQANELDNEKQVTNAQRFAADLPQTLVVREDAQGNVAVFHSVEKLEAGSPALLDDSKFVPMKKTDKMSELDGDSSKSGWYFYWYNYSYSYPTYYYYGYSYAYQPYYNYYYNNCYYRWYSWGWNWRWGW